MQWRSSGWQQRFHPGGLSHTSQLAVCGNEHYRMGSLVAVTYLAPELDQDHMVP